MKQLKTKKIYWPLSLCVLISFIATGCKKLVEVPEPTTTITIEKTFSNDANAEAAVVAIYYSMSKPERLSWGNSYTTLLAGACADEIMSPALQPYYQNSILPSDGIISNWFWTPAYYAIYQANAIIERLQSSPKVSETAKQQFIAEAKFFRAFCHFYLVNLFGDVPLLTKSDWRLTDTLSRLPAAFVYDQVIQDLKDAQAALSADYPGAGEKIRVNKLAVTALLARVYLYKGDWANAEMQASTVINSGRYNILADLNSVYLKNSDEAILQWQVPDMPQSKYATVEGFNLLPVNHTSSVSYRLTPSLLSAFEPGDLRRENWVDSSKFAGQFLYYPSKYKIKTGTAGDIKEYYMVLRYAEQYLIRAEARARIGTDLTGAIADIDILRERALLPDLDPSLNQSDVLAAIVQERRVELFAEWGHRWFDLKRTGQADAILGAKPDWNTEDQLWPIPVSEITRDPKLTQNAGY